MVGLTDLLLTGHIISVFICASINIPFYIDRNITNYPFGIFLIIFPIINIIYSGYIFIKYFRTDFHEFF